MALPEHEIAKLILKFISKEISPEEMELLQEYLDASAVNRKRFAALTKMPVLKKRLRDFYNSTSDEAAGWERIRRKLYEEALPMVVHQRSFHWVRYAAAAMVIITAGVLTYEFAGKQS